MKEPSRLAQHFARTEGRYFLSILMLIFVLYYIGITYGLKQSLDEVKNQIVASMYDACLKSMPMQVCDKQKRLFISEDFTQELQDIRDKKDGAMDSIKRKSYIVTTLPLLTDPELQRIVCNKAANKSDSKINEAGTLEICQCISLEGSKRFSDARESILKLKTMEEMSKFTSNLEKEVAEGCLKKLGN